MFDKGFFGDLFDFNNDGKLDMFEQAADFAAFQNMVKQSELEENGLDYDEIELMIMIFSVLKKKRGRMLCSTSLVAQKNDVLFSSKQALRIDIKGFMYNMVLGQEVIKQGLLGIKIQLPEYSMMSSNLQSSATQIWVSVSTCIL